MSKRIKIKRNKKMGLDDVCICCRLQDSIKQVLAEGKGLQPIPAPRLFYLAVARSSELRHLIDRFGEALSILLQDGVIMNNDGGIELAERGNGQAQSKGVN